MVPGWRAALVAAMAAGLLMALLANLMSFAGRSAMPTLRQPEFKIEMFVAVLTAPLMETRRRNVRSAWNIPKNVAYRFMLCLDSKGKTSEREIANFGDIMFLDCVEGYTHGLLTRKVAASLGAFLKYFPKVQWFFKTDDDTYPKLYSLLTVLKKHSGRNVFAGRLSAGFYPPDRDPTHKFYEPIDVFPGKAYPRAPLGGPGYILEASLVRFIVKHGIPEKHVLWNEDQAVGVWVNESAKLKMNIDYLYLAGLNGYKYQFTVCHLTEGNLTKWVDNDIFMIHRVTLKQMECLGGKRRIRRKEDCDC